MPQSILKYQNAASKLPEAQKKKGNGQEIDLERNLKNDPTANTRDYGKGLATESITLMAITCFYPVGRWEGPLEGKCGKSSNDQEEGEGGHGKSGGSRSGASIDSGGSTIRRGDADANGPSGRVSKVGVGATVGVDSLNDAGLGAGRSNIGGHLRSAINVATVESGGTNVGGNGESGGALAGGARVSLDVGVASASRLDRCFVQAASSISGYNSGSKTSVAFAGVGRSVSEGAEVNDGGGSRGRINVEADTSGVVDGLLKIGRLASSSTSVALQNETLGSTVASGLGRNVVRSLGVDEASRLVDWSNSDEVSHVGSAGRAVQTNELAGQDSSAASFSAVASGISSTGDRSYRKQGQSHKTESSDLLHLFLEQENMWCTC